VSAYSIRQPLTINIAQKLLPATVRTIALPFLIQTDMLVSLWSQHHLLLSIHLRFLWCDLRRLSRRSFHNYMLHFYIHRSYQWTLYRYSEQACIIEPFAWRGYVSFAALGALLHLFFVSDRSHLPEIILPLILKFLIQILYYGTLRRIRNLLLQCVSIFVTNRCSRLLVGSITRIGVA
jgi:hypothetical protein